ncbi:MAG: hypothetical protein ABIR73_02495 [Usitatibacter sp.]
MDNEDAYSAIGAAFDAVLRQREEQTQIQRGEVKRHREERGEPTS